MDSVFTQSRLPNEYWIIDGSNNNEIHDYLINSSLPPYVSWLSEPDKGISDALNKGISKATSQIIHLLHSADTYYDNTVINTCMSAFENDSELMWTHGQYKQLMGKNWVITGAAFKPNKMHLGMRKISHPTMFVKKQLYQKYGTFKLHKKLAMDYDFIIRIRNEKFKYLPTPIVNFAPDGASNKNWQTAFSEVLDSYKEYIGNDYKIYISLIKQHLFYRLIDTKIGKWLLALKSK